LQRARGAASMKALSDTAARMRVTGTQRKSRRKGEQTHGGSKTSGGDLGFWLGIKNEKNNSKYDRVGRKGGGLTGMYGVKTKCGQKRRAYQGQKPARIGIGSEGKKKGDRENGSVSWVQWEYNWPTL